MVLHGLKRVAENLNVPESLCGGWLKRPEAKVFLWIQWTMLAAGRRGCMGRSPPSII